MDKENLKVPENYSNLTSSDIRSEEADIDVARAEIKALKTKIEASVLTYKDKSKLI